MFDTVFGLPLHPLVVHATVVVVPSAALLVVLTVFWPRLRAWAGWLPAALAVSAAVLTPISTSSGESLEEKVGETALVEKHAEYGDLLLWWVLPLAVLAVALWWFGRHDVQPRVRQVVAGLAVVVAIGTLVMVALIGHSGAKAAWSDASGSDAGWTARTWSGTGAPS